MPEPDFSEFDDWLEEKTGPWPPFWRRQIDKKNLIKTHEEIVSRNAELLHHRDAWNSKSYRFEESLHLIQDVHRREQQRSRYHIHLDRYVFEDKQNKHDYSKYLFPCSISFSGAQFKGSSVSFVGAQFSDGNVNFNGTNFGEKHASFAHAWFGHGDVSFSGAQFGSGEIEFNSSRFGIGYVRFNNARLGGGNLWFDGAQFGDGDVMFVRTDFGDGDVSFYRAEFGNCDVRFDDSRFGHGGIWLEEARFKGGILSFDRVRFGGGQISLDGATCNGQFFFTPENVDGSVLSFDGFTANGDLFVMARRPQSAIFTSLFVSGTADFSNCAFVEIPDFRDAKFDRPPEVAQMDVPLPQMQGIWPLQISKNPEDVAKFRKLKAMAIEANDHERDSYFFAREMMAKRGVETVGFWALLLDSAYALLSNYGQSISRPIWGFIASFAAFAVAYTLPLLGKVGFEQAVVFAVEYSAHNFFPLLNTLFRFALTPSGFTTGFETRLDAIHRQLFIHGQTGLFDWIVAASVLQQLVGGVLLFLLLLGLRNKFRLK